MDIKQAISRILVAVDMPYEPEGRQLIKELRHVPGFRIKIGPSIINAGDAGRAIETTEYWGGKVVLWDGKEYDTGPAMAQGAAALGTWAASISMFNVSALAGKGAMAGVRKQLDSIDWHEGCKPKVVAVTIPTTMSADEVDYLFGKPVDEMVLRLALWAKEAGMDGLICSPLELPVLKRYPQLDGLIYVTPSIRPAGSDPLAQQRPTSPARAILNGSDYLVVGSPIYAAKDTTPSEALLRIAEEVAAALQELEKITGNKENS